jgi:hypothetical protein
MSEIIYTSTCTACDEHATLLGNLASAKRGIFESKDFCELNNDQKLKLVEQLFIQFCLDKRTDKINAAKTATTAQIQSYKIKNINAIKEG